MFGKKFVCMNCGSVGPLKTQTKGSLGLEILLWIFFLIPGIIYSIWRHSSTKEVCKACGSMNLVPVDSPKGQELMKNK
jgi:hypothetical protein